MALSSKDTQLSELKDLIKNLNKTVEMLQKTIAELRADDAQLKQERDNLKEQVDFLTKKLFGKSSEKKVIDMPGQYNLFDEAETEQDVKALAKEEKAAVTEKHSKKNKTTFDERFAGLKVYEKVLDLPESEKFCTVCGTALVPIGRTFVRKEFVFVPAKGRIIKYYSLNYKCPECDKISTEPPVIMKGSDGHPHMLHGMASPSTIAWVMYQKYCSCIPLYRQESTIKDELGIDIGRATLANWIISNGTEFFKPMFDYFHRTLIKRHHAMADETPVQILKEPGKRPESKSYMWVFHSGEDGKPPIVLYKYSPTRAGDTAADFLDGFNGYLMTDGYSGYNKVTTVVRTSCWAHARRYLIDAIPKGKEDDMTQPAVQGVIYTDKLFSLERDIHQKNKTADEIKEARLQKEKPVLEAFWSWLDKQAPVHGSRMDKAVNYISARKQYLINYLEDGYCSFSNNASERAVKPFVMGRKNWLFSDTVKGAEASSLVYTMIEMAKANGANPYHYLYYLLDKAPSYDMSDEELELLAPWNESVRDKLNQRAIRAQFDGDDGLIEVTSKD